MFLSDLFRIQCRSVSSRNPYSFIDNPNDSTAREFIESYFDSRSKGMLFNIDFTNRDSLFSKSIHTLSAFLLGMFLRDISEQRIINLIQENTSKSDLHKFEYPWFLSCLYHDAFSQYEEKHNTSDFPAKLSDAINQLEIKHTIYQTDFPEGLAINPFQTTYQQKTIEAYYNYRYKKMTIDHGILSGIIGFDRLVKNFLEKWTENENREEFLTSEGSHTLLWHKDQLWVFGLTADAIIAHNIWHLGPEENLPKEITLDRNNREEKKLSLYESPLAFYLSLIDTIEPIKFFNGVIPKKLMENITIEWDKENRKITIGQTDLQIFDFEKWYKAKMRNMDDWLFGVSSDYSDGKIEITLNNKKTRIQS